MVKESCLSCCWPDQVFLLLILAARRYERTAEIVAVLQRDPSLQVAVKDDSTDQGSTIKISVQLQDAGRMGLANPATTQAKAKALATLLPLYGNADLDGGTVRIAVPQICCL